MRKDLPACDFQECRFYIFGNCSSREKSLHCKVNTLKDTCNGLIAGQETLQKALAEKIAEVEELTGNLKFVRGTVERQKAEIERLQKRLSIAQESMNTIIRRNGG